MESFLNNACSFFAAELIFLLRPPQAPPEVRKQARERVRSSMAFCETFKLGFPAFGSPPPPCILCNHVILFRGYQRVGMPLNSGWAQFEARFC